MKSTNSTHLERWLGAEQVAAVSKGMRGFYGPPIALAGVPGAVFVTNDGDFIGECRAGAEATSRDRLEDIVRRAKRAVRRTVQRAPNQLNTGFASLSDLISEFTAGKGQQLPFYKTGVVSATSTSTSLFQLPGMPTSGGSASAAPGGDACTRSTTGALQQTNASGSDTTHFLNAWATTNIAGTLLLYDRIFQVAKTMSSSSTEAVTGTPSRYQGTTAGAANYAGGNFLFPEVVSTLSSTSHSWTTCTYKNQAGSSSNLPSTSGLSAAATGRNDLASSLPWFAPLATGDVGIKSLTQMQCSTASLTGSINFVIGHPLAFIPCPVANTVCMVDGVNTAFNLVRIYDDACLAFLDIQKTSSTNTTWAGHITICSG